MDRRHAPRIRPAPGRHPFGVGPGEARGVADDRGGRGPQLRAEADRIRLERQQRSVGADDFVLVDRPVGEPRNEDLPDAGTDAPAHRMAPAVPRVEIADDRNASRVRRPHCEVHAGVTLMLDRMRAQPIVELRMRPFADKPVVDRAQHRSVGVRIVDRPCPVTVRGEQPVGGPLRDRAFEEARGVAARQVGQQFAVGGHRVDALGAGHERAHDDPPVRLVRTQHRERIVVAAFDDGLDDGGGQGSHVPRARSHALTWRDRALVQCPDGSAPQMSRA